MAVYRIRIDQTYNTTANANTATSNINAVLTDAGRPERASRSGSTVTLEIDGLTEEEAKTLKVGLTPAWGVGTRSGLVSTVRRGEN